GEPRRRGDLRGIQGDRQCRDRPGPRDRGAAHLPRDQHRAERHPPRGATAEPRRAGEDVSAAAGPTLALARGRHPGAAEATFGYEDQRRAYREDARLTPRGWRPLQRGATAELRGGG